MRAAGDRPAQRRWSRDEVSAALHQLASELRRTPRARDLDRRADMPSHQSVALHFKTFRQALAANGMRPATPRPYNDAELVAALRDAHRRLGRVPRRADFARMRPHTETIARRFGSFAAALQAAAIAAPRNPQKR